jgi:hypothetical protein
MFILIILLNFVFASDCTDVQTTNAQVQTSTITTDVPKHLEDATIIVRTKDGRESQVSANKFKVVQRKQQHFITEVKTHTERVCKVSGKEKNLLMVGGRRDHKNLDLRVNGKTATVESEKGLVLDAAYLRQNIFDTNLGVGAGVDTNGTLKGIVGIEF